MKEFKKGDVVRCKEGFTNSGMYENPKYGGAGYESGWVFKIDHIVGDDRIAYFEKGKHLGVFGRALELAGWKQRLGK